MMSVPPPGGAPTTKRTGRVGYACAQAMRDKVGSAAAPAAICRMCLRWGSFISIPPSVVRLFDHLVGAGEQRRGDFDVEQSCSLEVDHQLEFGRLHNRQIGGLSALEDTSSIDTNLAIHVGNTSAIAHQPAGLDILTHRIGCRKNMARRQPN